MVSGKLRASHVGLQSVASERRDVCHLRPGIHVCEQYVERMCDWTLQGANLKCLISSEMSVSMSSVIKSSDDM